MKIKATARDFKAFVKDLLWVFVIIATLPITIPLAFGAMRKDDKEDSNEAK